MDKETLYSRWLNSQLTDEEIQELKSSGEWDVLNVIIEETNAWRLPEVEESQLEIIKTSIQSRRNPGARVVSINRMVWVYRAASVALVFSLVFWFFFRQDVAEFQNTSGTSVIQLPDSTEVRLMGRARIRYDRKNFARARKVILEGRAYLAVRKKGPFTASFEGGEVQVLGTQFEILAGHSIARVKCYEGRVKVLAEAKAESILNPGDGVRFSRDEPSVRTFEFDEPAPDNSTTESVFANAPLEEVIEAMQIQFDVEFDKKGVDVKRKYSGKFIHNDLQKSLDMVFTPMGIAYRFEAADKKKIILQ